MSQARRTCKGAEVSNVNARMAMPKVADDSVSRTVPPKYEKQRSRSKTKIPKSVRYELENSLVGLCDLWFEKIKPHLVRNNIKLHVNGAYASTACASGDFEQQQLPAVAFKCSHTEPATSAHECQLCRLLCNAANSIKSAVSQASSAQSSPGPVPTGAANS